MSQARPIPAEEVREALTGVLRRAEFHDTPSLFEQFLDWLFPDEGGGSLAEFQTVFVALLVVLLLWTLVRAVERLARRTPPEGEGGTLAALAGSPSERLFRLREAAVRARAAGESRLALRLLFEALLLALGDRGDLEFRPAWTNRELVRRGRHATHVQELLEQLVRELEPKEFGRERVEEADLARLEELLAAQLRAGGHGRAA